MKEQRDRERGPPEAPMLQPFPWLGPEQVSSVMGAQQAVLKQGDAVARLWQDSMQDALSSGQALSAELARCKTPQEVTFAYTDWLLGRYGRLASDSQEAWRMWLTLGQGAAAKESAGSGEDG